MYPEWREKIEVTVNRTGMISSIESRENNHNNNNNQNKNRSRIDAGNNSVEMAPLIGEKKRVGLVAEWACVGPRGAKSSWPLPQSKILSLISTSLQSPQFIHLTSLPFPPAPPAWSLGCSVPALGDLCHNEQCQGIRQGEAGRLHD